MERRLREDVAALAAMTRDSAGPGERASAAWLAGRLEAAGATDVRVAPYRHQGTYGWSHALHAAAGLPGRPLLTLAALVSLELEVSGRRQWLRRVLPAGEGANVVARVPAAGERRRTLVLVAHHDAARTGLFWHPAIAEAGAARRLRRRSIDPYQAPTALGMLLAAAPWRALRRIGRAVLAVSIAGALDVARSPTVPGASDNATGVAAVLELVRRFAAEPLDGVEVLAVLPGSEESGMGGMAAFLRDHRLDPASTFVLGLDTLGAGTPIVLRAEGALLTHRYRDEDIALVGRAAEAAGLDPPQAWRIGGWTDPILAVFAGLPAASLLSIGPKGVFTNYHRPTDVPGNVDWSSVDACVDVAASVAAYVRRRKPC